MKKLIRMKSTLRLRKRQKEWIRWISWGKKLKTAKSKVTKSVNKIETVVQLFEKYENDRGTAKRLKEITHYIEAGYRHNPPKKGGLLHQIWNSALDSKNLEELTELLQEEAKLRMPNSGCQSINGV